MKKESMLETFMTEKITSPKFLIKSLRGKWSLRRGLDRKQKHGFGQQGKYKQNIHIRRHTAA